MNSYIGQIKLFAFDFVPKGWLRCNGDIFDTVDYELLFTYIGRAYGDMNLPQDKFRIPDFRGVVPIHRGRGAGLNNTYVIGKTAGAASYTMKPENLPDHVHATVTPVYASPACSTGPANTPSPVNAYPAATPGQDSFASEGPAISCYTPLDATNVTVHPTGDNKPIPLIQPSLGLNYCICFDGIYPSQPD